MQHGAPFPPAVFEKSSGKNRQSIALDQFRSDGNPDFLPAPFQDVNQPLAGGIAELLGKLVYGSDGTQTLILLHKAESGDGTRFRNGDALLPEMKEQTHGEIVRRTHDDAGIGKEFLNFLADKRRIEGQRGTDGKNLPFLQKNTMFPQFVPNPLNKRMVFLMDDQHWLAVPPLIYKPRKLSGSGIHVGINNITLIFRRVVSQIDNRQRICFRNRIRTMGKQASHPRGTHHFQLGSTVSP